VEHNLDVVLALADRVFALERGAVFHDGPAAAAAHRSRLSQEDLVALMRPDGVGGSGAVCRRGIMV